MLTADKLAKSFSHDRVVNAVNEVSFSLEKGSFVAIVGRSGSGKSTLLAMLGGISKPSSGSVKVNDVDQWQLNSDQHADFRNRKIGFVFQFASLLPSLRIIDNVALPALVGGALNSKQAYAKAHALLIRVGLAEKVHTYPNRLSGGEQRRVAIARALINSPELLLADEPTADLDEETEAEILNLLVEVHRAFNLTLVVVTHNPEIAARADRVITMKGGHAYELSNSGTRAISNDHAVAETSDAKITEESTDSVKDRFEASMQLPEGVHQSIELGAGIERLIGRLILWMVPLVLLAYGINYGVASYQSGILEAESAKHEALEDLAMSTLRADIKDIRFGKNGQYLVDLYLRNTTDEKPIYLMAPTVRGFVQVGTSWQEAPMKLLKRSAQQVLTVTGEQIYTYEFEPKVENFTQLLPYYMHVRFSNDMLISASSNPKTELIERNDNYYVYLKPQGMSDAVIAKKLKFMGPPPIYVPMPPH